MSSRKSRNGSARRRQRPLAGPQRRAEKLARDMDRENVRRPPDATDCRTRGADPFGGEDEEQVGEDKIVAPLPGTVVALLAEVGAKLEKGAPILTLEVMKMEQTLRAPFAGVLKAIKCKVGDIVGEGVELAEIEPAGA